MNDTGAGKVFLVGAGPGEPGLITVRGRDCLAQAAVVVYDALTHPALLGHAPDAEHIFVGKKADRHSLPQDDINALLVRTARTGKTVVRLKGGDPFVFGRGGEEALALAAAGIPFEVVPGVTSGIAAPAFAGIPVSHRGLATSVTFITGHLAPDAASPQVDLARTALDGTLVFYMSVKQLPSLAETLIAMGRAADTPAALIEWATYARQRVVRGTLADIAAVAAEAKIEPPAICVVGEVAALADQLAWFESRPLHGLRVVLTHTARRADRLESRLRELGADVLSFPTLEIVPAPARDFHWERGRWDWLVLTSTNAAEMIFETLDAAGADARALADTRICAVGAATADAVERRFLRVDARPEGFGPETALAAMAARAPLEGARALIPRADIARRALATALRDAGMQVEEVQAYETRPLSGLETRLEKLDAYEAELVVFTNSAAARNFAQACGAARLKDLQEHAAFASIGPVTSGAAAEHGMPITIEPVLHEVPELIEAVCAWRAANQSKPEGFPRRM